MANEARINCGLYIRKTSSDGTKILIDYRGGPESYQADVDGTKGPTPGSFQVPTYGTTVSLSQLSTPGLAFIHNQDSTNFVELGIRDPNTGVFYPFMELLPGEACVLRFSRNLLEGYTNTGTGTTGQVNQLHAKANTSPVQLEVNAFEK